MKKPDLPTFGELIKMVRSEQGHTLRSLAAVLDVSPSYLSEIENDRRSPAESVIEKMATALNMSVDELMGYAGRFGKQAERYIKHHPNAVRLLRACAAADCDESELLCLEEYITQMRATCAEPQLKVA